MRATCIVLVCVGVGAWGCSSPPTSRPNPNPVPGTSAPRTSGSSAAPTPRPAPPTPQATVPPPAPATPSRPAPSLEQERAAQADRAAGALSRKAGVKVEKVETANPSWWPVGSAGGEGYGRGRAPTLDAAYQQATRQAAGGDRAANVQKAGYTRTAMGEYVVWVATGGQAAPQAAAAPAAPTPSAPTPVPAGPAPAAPSAPAAPAVASDIPSWFTTKAKEENGRVIVGAMADAPTVREAPRMASEAGKAALAEVMGVEPSEVRLESTYVRKQGEGYRAFVLVSCAGTIKK